MEDYNQQFCDFYQKKPSSSPSKCCKLIAFGNYCNRTEKERLDDARSRLDNRIFFMGITAHGYQKPIREAINPGHRDEYVGRPEIEQFLPKEGEANIDYAKLAEDFRSIDIYNGLVDGKNYGRFSRLDGHKLRHTRNPKGTEVRFCVPIANSMNYGWWTRDLKQLDRTKWYEPRERFPQIRGEITKFVDDMALHDPNFILF